MRRKLTRGVLAAAAFVVLGVLGAFVAFVTAGVGQAQVGTTTTVTVTDTTTTVGTTTTDTTTTETTDTTGGGGGGDDEGTAGAAEETAGEPSDTG